jgi:hypothetical protein
MLYRLKYSGSILNIFWTTRRLANFTLKEESNFSNTFRETPTTRLETVMDAQPCSYPVHGKELGRNTFPVRSWNMIGEEKFSNLFF